MINHDGYPAGTPCWLDTAEHAVALGGRLWMAPMDTPGFRSAVIADPQGGVIAISAPAH
jgi:predicted enzyme related to lactoylglutathione lyase